MRREGRRMLVNLFQKKIQMYSCHFLNFLYTYLVSKSRGQLVKFQTYTILKKLILRRSHPAKVNLYCAIR